MTQKMELNISIPVNIVKGFGELEFPKALKREPLLSTIQCQNLFFGSNSAAKNEPFMLICSGSQYWTQNQKMKNNVLAMFQNSKNPNTISFDYHPLPITSPQDKLVLEIVDFHGIRQNVSCLGTFHMTGKVANKLFAI